MEFTTRAKVSGDVLDSIIAFVSHDKVLREMYEAGTLEVYLEEQLSEANIDDFKAREEVADKGRETCNILGRLLMHALSTVLPEDADGVTLTLTAKT